MRVKLDENLPVDLVAELARLGHDADTAPREGLAGKPDAAVWAASQTAQRLLVTQDLDFSQSATLEPANSALPRAVSTAPASSNASSIAPVAIQQRVQPHG